MEEWVGVAVVAAAGIITYILCAVGGAALVFLWFPRLTRAAGALLAALAVPLIVAVMVLVIVTFNQGAPAIGPALAAIAIVTLPGLVFGWPFSFFTLRALERRIERAGIRASEIFE